MSTKSVNLVDDLAWIPVRLCDGTNAEFTIRETFHRASEIREITGELPTQSFAILRLLLAILLRVLVGEVTTANWRTWLSEGLPLQDVDEYLDYYRERFDLMSDHCPFFQVADLATQNGEIKDVSPLIADLPSNQRLFTNRSGSGARDLSLAEAARWLVHAQAFEASGIKSGAIGDPRVKGGRGYPIGVAWSGLLGGVFAQGDTLFHTLLLNLVAPDVMDGDPESDIPPWEDERPDTAAEREGLLPQGPVRLFTWQSRRVRLFEEGGRITGCLVANGDRLTPQNMYGLEPMTAWRYSKPQTKKFGQPTYMPREHIPGRALWRGVGALLPGVSAPEAKTGLRPSLPPRLIGWLEKLDSAGCLDSTTQFRLRAIGVLYGSNNSVIDELFEDSVILPVALLRSKNRALARQAETAVHLADDGVYAVRRLAKNLALAAGGDGEDAGVDPADRAYAMLDRPYRDWLRSLNDDTNPLAALVEWKSTARKLLLDVGLELATTAGQAAWVGREVSPGNPDSLITTPRAEAWFRRDVKKIFGPSAGKE